MVTMDIPTIQSTIAVIVIESRARALVRIEQHIEGGFGPAVYYEERWMGVGDDAGRGFFMYW